MQGFFCTLASWNRSAAATEIKILQKLNKEGITKDNLTREEFLKADRIGKESMNHA